MFERTYDITNIGDVDLWPKLDVHLFNLCFKLIATWGGRAEVRNAVNVQKAAIVVMYPGGSFRKKLNIPVARQ